MRSALVIGLCMGYALGVGVALSFGPAAAWVCVATSLLFLFWIIEDVKRLRRVRREDAQIAPQLAYFKETGRWPTML